MSFIRVIAIAVISRPSDGALLVYDGYDTVKRELYHRPLGGGIEFGETAEAAVRRELHEEMGVELDDVALLGFLENLFTCDGRPGHQIVAVFSALLERDRRFGVTRRTDTPNQRVHSVAAAQVRDSWPAGRLLHAR